MESYDMAIIVCPALPPSAPSEPPPPASPAEAVPVRSDLLCSTFFLKPWAPRSSRRRSWNSERTSGQGLTIDQLNVSAYCGIGGACGRC